MTFKNIFYDWLGANQELFLYFNHLFQDMPVLSKILSHLSILAQNFFVPFIIIFIALIVYFYACYSGLKSNPELYRSYLLKWIKCVAIICLSMLLVAIFIPSVKVFFNFKRPLCFFSTDRIIILPYLSDDTIPKMVTNFCKTNKSFPSAHSIVAGIFLFSLWPVVKAPIRLALILITLLIGLSRIVIGVHYPADIAAGYLFAALFVYIANLIYKYLQKNLTIMKLFG
jgi:membrane-associated phospholipid phosphatase